MINAEGKTYAFSPSVYQKVITVITKVYKIVKKSLYCTLLSSIIINTLEMFVAYLILQMKITRS